MGERLETIDGTFAIRSTPGVGTTVEVVVPLHATEDYRSGLISRHADSA